jgi:hypothetical protein
LPLEVPAKDFQSEPLVLGVGQRVTQFRISPGRLKKPSRLAAMAAEPVDLRASRLSRLSSASSATRRMLRLRRAVTP